MRFPYRPVHLPTSSPEELSTDARRAMSDARMANRTAGDLDPAVLAELLGSGLATLHPKYVTGVDDPIDEEARLGTTSAHPMVSTCGIGRGPSDIDVYLASLDGRDPLLIAALRGTELSQSGTQYGELPKWRISVRSGATDFEHDSCRHADMEIIGLTLVGTAAGVFELVGTLAEIRMFPLGVDPLTYDDGESSPTVCTYKECADDRAHRIAAYIPPERDDLTAALAGRLVSVIVYPRPGSESE